MKLAALLTSPLFIGGALATVTVGGVALAARRGSGKKQVQLASREALREAIEVSPAVAAALRERVGHITQKVNQLDPYSLVSATAMCRTILRWAGSSASAQQAGVITRGQNLVREILSSDLSEREQVRALVLGVALPFLVSSDGSHEPVETDAFHFEIPRLMLYSYANTSQPGGTPLQQSRIMNAVIWCGMYMLTPGTACVRRGAALGAPGSALPPPGGIALPLSTWMDSEWELSPTSDQRLEAMVDLWNLATLFPRALYLSSGDVEYEYGCRLYEPNPCIQFVQWSQLANGAISDAREYSGLSAGTTAPPGLDPVAIEGANQSLLQLAARALLEQTQPRVGIPPTDKDPFAIIMTAIGVALSAVGTVLSAGAASGLLAASVATTFALVSGAATSAIALAQAVHGAADVGSAVQAVVSSSLGEALLAKATLLPSDITAAGQLVASLTKSPAQAPASMSLPQLWRATF